METAGGGLCSASGFGAGEKLTQASANAWRQICVVCESSVKQDCWGSPWPAAVYEINSFIG